MSSVLLKQGHFETIGDQAVLRLSPVFSVVSFDSFTNVVLNVTGARTFTKEFRYSIDNITFTSYQPLTNGNLSAIIPNPSLLYYFDIRYTRSGIDTTGVLEWEQFCLELTCNPGALIRINKSNYDSVFGQERYLKINQEISTFSVQMMIEHNVVVGIIDDPTVQDLNVLIVPQDNNFDYNILQSTDFGNMLLRAFKNQKLDTFSGFESQ